MRRDPRRKPPPLPRRPDRHGLPCHGSRLGGLPSRCRRFQVADEGLLQCCRAAVGDQSGRRVARQHPAGVHQRDAVAALGLVHEVGRDEDGDLVAAGEVDQVLPEGVPCHRVDARSRLVEDQQLGLVDQRHRQRESLPLPQGERVRQDVDDLRQAEALDGGFNPVGDLLLRDLEQPCVEDQVLPDRQLGIEREALRHVAHPPPGGEVLALDLSAEQPGLSFARRQQARQHLHGRRLAAAVGAEEAEDLAPLDPEAHPIDSDEIAEATGQAPRLDGRLVRHPPRGEGSPPP